MLKFPTKYIVLWEHPNFWVIYYHTGLLKWLFAGFGFLFLAYPGIVVGFIVGSMLEMQIKQKEGQAKQISDVGTSYMRLAYSVIRSGGSITEKKKQHAYRYIARHFGVDYLRSRIHIFESISQQHIEPNLIARNLNHSMEYAEKLHLIYFLLGIASARSIRGPGTLLLITSIAEELNIAPKDLASMLAMHQPTSDRAYQILELEPQATDEEVRKAYRSLAKQHHPDKVGHLGDAYEATAKEKFLEIQQAYQEIKDKRNMS